VEDDMGIRGAVIVAAILGVPATGALAQQPPAPEPALLTLPMGARVRLQTGTAGSQWLRGVLVGADSASVGIVPEEAPPLGANQLRLPMSHVTRFELKTGSKRQWLRGLIVGVAAGVALGFAIEVDPVACTYDNNYECSRGAALALGGATFGAIGAGVGALVKTERWTPVALDALAPPAPRVSGVAPRLRVLPRGGATLGLVVGF
jgi:hypothetical protein